MIQADLNYWAILVSAVVAFAIGSVWYLPKVFGNTWMILIGKTEMDVKMGLNRMMFVKTFVASLVMMYILAHFVDYAAATTVGQGAATGIWLWLGFVATTIFTNSLYENRPLKLWAINAVYHLVVLIITGAILAVWA